MLNNDRLSDVKFVAANSNGESESKQVIPAHKFILAIGSPVFEAMFYGELLESRDTIELPDCDYESLLELFRYMYSDEVNLSGSNVLVVLYLAKKYMVPSLADKCSEYLQENLDPSNVFTILPFAQQHDNKILVDRCWKEIDEGTDEAVNADGFEKIERSLLEAVVSRDALTIKEVALFQAADRWATKQCEKQGLVADGQLKRRILGEEIIKSIRFPIMTAKEFADVVLDTNILHPNEITFLFKFFNSSVSSPLMFSKSPRQSRANRSICRCGRFQSLEDKGWDYFGKKDFLSFTVDRNITLHGLCLFGSENNSYTVTLEVKDISNGITVVSKSGTYPSKRLQYEQFSYYGFKVFFDFAARLKKNTDYHIEALISGPQSGKGVNGYVNVGKSSVTFSFLETEHRINSNLTSTKAGQFPEFLFSV